jgi:hypothetical protein
LLNAGVSQGVILAQRREHRTHFALPETEAAERGEDLRLNFEQLRLGHMTVRAAIGMAEANPAGRVFFDQERAAMDRAVMRSADGENIFQNIATALGPQLDVVEIEERGVATAWHAAAMLIAREHGPAQVGSSASRVCSGSSVRLLV